MMTNLLHAIEFPEKMNIIQTDIGDYRELNKIVRGVPKHLKSNKLFFFGDIGEIYQILDENSYKAELFDPIEVNEQPISEYWDILRILFYRVIKNFLRGKGFYFHNDIAYMVESDNFKENFLIRKDNMHNYYIHEGFGYNLHLINQNVFLSLNPRIVLTKDKKENIIPKENGSRFYTYQWSRRYNSVTRDLLKVWLEFLSDTNGITIPIPNEDSLIFESKFCGTEDIKSGRKGRWA